VFLDGYHPVDLVAERVGDVKDFLIANGVVEPLNAEVEISTEVVKSAESSPNYIRGKEFVSETLIPFMNSAREFWLHLNTATVDALMTQIDEISAKGELAMPSLVEVGSFCLAQYPDDGRWYRAIVTSMVCYNISDSEATVYYVDYGNSCNVKVYELREIPPAVAEIPHQAVRCSLYGIEHAEESVEEAFATEYETLVVSAKFVKMVDDRLSVRLFDANDGSDVNQKLGIPLVEEVYISHTESPCRFWVQLKSNSDSISEIQDQLSNEGNFFSCHFTFPSNSLSLNSRCCRVSRFGCHLCR
jgi:tudor domain-containing protein 1/4/6/7